MSWLLTDFTPGRGLFSDRENKRGTDRMAIFSISENLLQVLSQGVKVKEGKNANIFDLLKTSDGLEREEANFLSTLIGVANGQILPQLESLALSNPPETDTIDRGFAVGDFLMTSGNFYKGKTTAIKEEGKILVVEFKNGRKFRG